MSFNEQLENYSYAKDEAEAEVKRFTTRLEELAEDGASSASHKICKFAEGLVEHLKVDEGDSGPFDSKFCYDVQELVKKRLTEYIKEHGEPKSDSNFTADDIPF